MRHRFETFHSTTKGEGMTRIRFARWAVVLSALAIVSAACAQQPEQQPADGETQVEGVFLMAADGVLSDTFMETPESEDMFFSGPATPEDNPAYEEFVAAYEEEYGEPPISAYHAHAYDAVMMLLAAVEEVAQVQGQSITIDRTELREALYATEGFEGLTGTLSCDVFGDCADPNVKVFHNGADQETLADVHGNVVFELEEGEDPLGTNDAPAPDYSTDVEPLQIGPGDPFKLAAMEVITTESASLGEDQVRGIELAISDYGGEFEGHEITLQVEDEGCDSEVGTTAAEKVVSDPQIVGIIGTSCSGAGVPAAQIMSEAGLVMISGSNTSPFLTSLAGEQASDWQPGYLRTAHNDQIQGLAAATYAFEELGVTSAATIHDGDPYTQGLAEAFGTAFQDLGGEVSLATAINVGDTDMRPVLTEVQNSGAQFIYFPIFEPEGNFIADQARDIFGTVLTEPL
jgi:ABC-type branched-subunit amino acid transport system substrate-binding protein